MSDQPDASPKQADVKISYIGDSCPVQGWGMVNNNKFYFRARGSYWSMRIGGDNVISSPDWVYEEIFGNWPDAGYMSMEQAELFIRKAAGMFASGCAPYVIPD